MFLACRSCSSLHLYQLTRRFRQYRLFLNSKRWHRWCMPPLYKMILYTVCNHFFYFCSNTFPPTDSSVYKPNTLYRIRKSFLVIEFWCLVWLLFTFVHTWCFKFEEQESLHFLRFPKSLWCALPCYSKWRKYMLQPVQDLRFFRSESRNIITTDFVCLFFSLISPNHCLTFIQAFLEMCSL